MRTIAVINQKGGVGKTTSVANLGAGLARRGRSVCLMDLDPQSHLTLHFGLEPGESEASTYDLLIGDTPLRETALRIDENLALIPAVIDLAAAEVELVTTVGREQILADRLADADAAYDVVMIDCPPSLGLLTLNALAAADEVIIPLQPHFLALQGLGKLLETVLLVQRRINPDLRVSGVILCMFEGNTRLAGEVVDDLKEFFASAGGQDVPWSDVKVFEPYIRRNIKLAESPSHGKTIFDYDPSSNGARDYNALTDNLISHLFAEEQHAAPPPEEPGEQAAPSSPEGEDRETITQAGEGAPSPLPPAIDPTPREVEPSQPAKPRPPGMPPVPSEQTGQPNADEPDHREER